MPSATLQGVVIADAPESDVLHIEGSVYFPPTSVRHELLEPSSTPYTCPWKGECQYFSVRSGNGLFADRAWSYRHPRPTAFERVGADFSHYVAFRNEVEVE